MRRRLWVTDRAWLGIGGGGDDEAMKEEEEELPVTEQEIEKQEENCAAAKQAFDETQRCIEKKREQSPKPPVDSGGDDDAMRAWASSRSEKPVVRMTAPMAGSSWLRASSRCPIGNWSSVLAGRANMISADDPATPENSPLGRFVVRGA